MITRRSFFQGVTALVGGVLLEEAIPFGRVWSFPSRVTTYRTDVVGRNAVLFGGKRFSAGPLENYYSKEFIANLRTATGIRLLYESRRLA